MRINRSLLNWGVFLIALGGIPLAVDQGWLDSDVARDLGQLWPLILVGIGLGLILRWTSMAWFGGALVAATFGLIFGAAYVSVRDNEFTDLQGIIPAIANTSCAGTEVGEATTSEGGIASVSEFRLEATLSCGELEISRATGATWSLEARHDPDDPPRVEEIVGDGVATGVRLSQDDGDDLVFLGWRVQNLWTVEVPSGSALRLESTLNAATGTYDAGAGPIERLAGTFNASDVTIDLGSASTPATASIDLTLNASDGRLALPAGDLTGDITLNASSLDICVPTASALRVDYSSVLGGDDLGASGLSEERPGRWLTEGFDEATDRVSLSITNTVSSLSIERPETCP